MGHVSRTRFLIVVSTLCALASLNANSQPAVSVKVGYISSSARDASSVPPRIPAALAARGWVEGRNLTIEWRFAGGDQARVAEQAKNLSGLGLDVVIAPNNEDALAMKGATSTMPIVLVFANDPIKAGFAKTLNRPGGNITGVIWGDPSFSAKSMQVMKEMIPGMRRLGIVYTDGQPGIEPFLAAAEAAARDLGFRYLKFPVRQSDDVESILQGAKAADIDGLRIVNQGVVGARLDHVLKFAIANKLPTSSTGMTPVERGALMSYTPSLDEQVQRTAIFVDKILRGAKPAVLPFEYTTKYELAINLRTAKQLGIKVPQSILLRADRVIE